MKCFSLFAAALALVSVCQAASDAAVSAREAAQQYGAAVRNCDMRWAVDSMYPPLRRTYADQLTSRTREAEIARARRVQGLDRETVEEARARMAANDKALRAKYARMGEDMKKSGLTVESYTVGEATAEYVVTPPMAAVSQVRKDTSGRVRAENIGSTQERSRIVVLPTTLVISAPAQNGRRTRMERRSYIFAVRDEIITDKSQPRGTVPNKWYFIDGNTDVNTLRTFFPNLPLYLRLPATGDRILR
ncbi:MAG: hypothetical protein IJN23_00445 [Akkermansia sp.]|nr:hypothetical protein [Akkermansia sp.]